MQTLIPHTRHTLQLASVEFSRSPCEHSVMRHLDRRARARSALALATVLGTLLPRPCLGASPDEGGWTDAGTKHGVALAFRENPRLAAREVRATSEMPFPAEMVFSVVCDFPRYPEFVPGMLEATTLEGTSPADYVVYMRYAPKFLVIAPRDVILQLHGGPEPTGEFRCTWSELPDRLPNRPGVVRMPIYTGSWTLEPIGAARTRVVYQVAIKPGGRIPDWLVRWGAARALPEEMQVVQKRLAAMP